MFIDPPYNTGSVSTHFDDGMEHSIWLSLMRNRLEIVRRLLSEEDSLPGSSEKINPQPRHNPPSRHSPPLGRSYPSSQEMQSAGQFLMASSTSSTG